MSDAAAAQAMLSAFASVGVKAFDITLIDLNEEKTGFNSNRSVDSLSRTIGRMLQDADERHHNLIVRPRANGTTLIQLDDLSTEKAGNIAPHAFIVFQTSPGNCQAWVALTDAPADVEQAKDFARRLRKGAGPTKARQAQHASPAASISSRNTRPTIRR